ILLIISSSPRITNKQKVSGRINAMSPIYSRINLYAASSRMFIEKPIFGFGFNNFKKFSSKYFYKVRGIPFQGVGLTSHDTLFSLLVELGLLGVIPILLIYFYIFKYSAKLYNRLAFDSFINKKLIVTFWGTSIIYIVNMQFIQMRFFLFANSLFFLLAGIIMGLNQRLLLNKTDNGPK
ncbi:MAG: O-antigen ligase family protein, partial [Promethearchaeota archaeon]